MNKESKFKPFSILVTGTDDSFRHETEAILHRSTSFIVKSDSAASVSALGKDPGIDAVVVAFQEFGEDELDLLNGLNAHLPNAPKIVVSAPLGDGQVRQLIRLHVQDWLTRPLDGATLVKSIDTCVRTAKTNRNKVHAVVSGEAGSGASVVAASFADMIANQTASFRENVALFDLDFSTGAAGYILNLANTFDLKPVLAHPERIDFEFINLIRETHPRGFHVFSFKKPEMLTSPNGSELVLRMLDAVNIQNEHTVLDVPYYMTDWRDEVLAAVNTCTIVTELNLPALRQAYDTVREVRGIRGDAFPVNLMVNKYKKHLFRDGLGTGDVRELFGDVPISLLPYDDGLIEESLNRGVLPYEVRPKSAFVRGLKKYVTTLLAEQEARP